MWGADFQGTGADLSSCDERKSANRGQMNTGCQTFLSRPSSSYSLFGQNTHVENRRNTHRMPNSSQSRTRKTAVMTCVRNDSMFLNRWIDYYGALFGCENLYVVFDGLDQPLPARHAEVNITEFKHKPMRRSVGDKYRARLMSDQAKSIFADYDAVIVVDVDEFLIPDPAHYTDLADFIERADPSAITCSGLGLDVAQHSGKEDALDANQPFLGQRRFAQLSTRYTKPAIAFHPIRWGSGQHRVKGRNFHIDPHLYLFHFGMIDQEGALERITDTDRLKSGWKGHLRRRQKLFDVIASSKTREFEETTASARWIQTYFRQLQAWNKPSLLGRKLVVEIPERFFGIV